MNSKEEKRESKQQKKEQKSVKEETKKQATPRNQEDSKKENKNEKKAEKKEQNKENIKDEKFEKKDQKTIIDQTFPVSNISSESRKQKKKFFCLTSFEEYSEQQKSNKQENFNDNSSKCKIKHSNNSLSIKLNIFSERLATFNSKKLITILENKNLSINEEMEVYLLKLSTNKIGGISKVCREFFKALQTFIKKVDFVNLREMKEKIDTILELISVILSPGDRDDFTKEIKILGAVDNSFKFIRNLLHSIEKLRPKFSEKLRNFICKKLDEFVSTKIEATREAVADNASEIIKENDVILLFGKSEMYRLALEKAKRKVKNFKIIFVDIYGRDSSKGIIKIVYSELEYFSNLGVEVIYTYINGVSALISKVTKVFILARCMFANGYLLGNNGASMIACLAFNYKKPVIAFCETYKFCEKSQMDSYLYNNIIIENNQNTNSNQNGVRLSEESVNFLNMQYDLTPANYINMIICELGYLPTTSVPVVLREFGKIIELEEKELNYELK